MTVEQFAAMTRRVIASNGFDEFLPTACYPERREVTALEGLPPDIEPEPAVLKWAAKRVRGGEVYLVCRTGAVVDRRRSVRSWRASSLAAVAAELGDDDSPRTIVFDSDRQLD